MIVIQFKGGFGNQMFQYAFGRALSLEKGVPVFFDRSLLDDQSLNLFSTYRAYELDHFELNLNFTSSEYQLAKYLRGTGPLQRFILNLKRSVGILKIIKEKGFSYSPHYFEEYSSGYFSGYWQSPLYFEKFRKEICKDFSYQPQHSSQDYLNLLEQITTSRCAVALHIRRGDYITNPKNTSVNGFLGIQYPDNAIAEILKLKPKIDLFIFSDDISWCRENLKYECSTTFVSLEGQANNFFLEFNLMRQCQHFIITNSTFSWWAAWLSENPNKIVIAPKKWFLNQTMNAQTSSLVPNDWIRV